MSNKLNQLDYLGADTISTTQNTKLENGKRCLYW